MQNHGNLMFKLGVTLLVSVFQFVWAASVEATVSTQEVVPGNPVQLHIKAIGKNAVFPDISEVDGSRVVSTSTSSSSSYVYVNGENKSEHSTSRLITFVPMHDMTVPSYTVNIEGTEYKTQAIDIKIVKSKATPQGQNDDKFSFVLRSDKKSVFLGESFVVTVYISVSNRLRGVQISDYVEPNSPDFFMKEVESQKEYQKDNYSIIEKQYIATAKKEGNTTIAPASAKIGLADTRRPDIFGRYAMMWNPVASNSLALEIKAQEKTTDLVGDFSIESKLDAQKVKANKPVNLTVKIEGEGSLEDFEFPKYEIDGVTVYGDDAKVESHLEGSILRSTYSKNFAFIAEEDFVIPAKRISVYDSKNAKVKELIVQRYEVSVEGSKEAAVLKSSEPSSHGTVQTNINTEMSKQKEDKGTKEQVEVKTVAWWMLIMSFFLGALFMVLLKWLPSGKNSNKSHFTETEALKILYAHISEDTQVEAMVRQLYARKNGDKGIKIDKKVLKEMVERFI